MAFFHGRQGGVAVGETDGTYDNDIAQITEWSLTHSVELAEARVMRQNHTSRDYGHEDWEGSISLLLDKDNLSHQKIIEVIRNRLKLYGEFSLDESAEGGSFTGRFLVGENEVTAESEDYIAMEVSISGDSELVWNAPTTGTTS